jgi:hypothetical protein
VLTSKEGTYHWQNGAMTARGDVVGTAPDGRTLRTSELVYDPMGKKIRSDQHFTFDRGGDHLEGEGFLSDPDFKNVVVTHPRGAEGGGPQLLPRTMRVCLPMGFLALFAASLSAQGEACRFELIHVGQQGTSMETATGTNYFAGGGVVLGCLGTKVRMSSDSVASYGGTIGIVQFLGNVKYEDTTITMTATNGTYFKQGERWEARGDVVMQNLESGSTLTGPSLDYYRALKGTRDTLEMYAVGRPRINFVPQDSTGKAEEPYVINADRVRMKGNDRMWGAGRVTIDRSDFAATSDSMRLDTGAGTDGTLLGSPVLRGLGADSFNLRASASTSSSTSASSPGSLPRAMRRPSAPISTWWGTPSTWTSSRTSWCRPRPGAIPSAPSPIPPTTPSGPTRWCSIRRAST